MRTAAKPIPSAYEAEILRQAERICQWSDSARDKKLVWIRGLIAAHRGYDDVAIACLRRAVVSSTAPACVYLTLGEMFLNTLCFSEAVAVCFLALTRHHHEVSVYRLLARALRLSDRGPESALVLAEAARLHRASPELCCDLADLYLVTPALEAAKSQYRSALSLNPRAPRALTGLARVHLAQGECEVALNILESDVDNEKTRAAPAGDTEAALCRAEALDRIRHPDEALATLRDALKHCPDILDICLRLVELLSRLGRVEEVPAVRTHIGTLLQRAFRHAEALTQFEEALRHKPNSLHALASLGQSYLGIGQPRISMPILETVLMRDPNHAATHSNLGQASYLVGDDERAWNEFAWQYRSAIAHRQIWEQPTWDGSLLDGKTILLWTDQGRGDAIQFIRYIPYARRCGGNVLVHCHCDRLFPFLERMPAVSQVVAPGAPMPHFDVQAPLVYLPGVLVRRPAIEGVPYLSADSRLVECWRRRVKPDGRFTVGLSWGGNIEHGTAETRFVSLSLLGPLGAVCGIRFVSLQHGPQTAELLSPPAGLTVDSVLDFDSSIDDVAALMMNVDLVITVDTMTAHLAGALARPTWTLLRRATNWRWKLEGERTPWYPTMRLFRQKQAGDWRSVINEIAEALAERQAKTV